MSSQDSASKKKSNSTKLAMTAILAALALIFSYVEAMIPSPVGIPGVKLGVANIVILLALYELDVKHALIINIIRILISGFLFSGVFGILYSMAGALLSILLMWLLKKTNLFSIIGVSMAGGVAHNIGQILIASLIVSDIKMFLYLPILMFSGIISGILIGILCHYLINIMKKLQ